MLFSGILKFAILTATMGKRWREVYVKGKRMRESVNEVFLDEMTMMHR